MKIIFENSFYRAVMTTPEMPASGTVVFFGSIPAVDPQKGHAAFPDSRNDNFITRAGLNGVFVHAALPDWYQNSTIIDCTKAILATIHGTGPIITYGTSMGGFGAVAHAGHVGADLFLVGSPQVSLMDEYMKQIGDRRWGGHRKNFTADIIRRGNCRDQRGVVAFDPKHREDSIHAQAILRQTKALPLLCHGTDHFAIERLARDIGLQNALTAITNCTRDEDKLTAWVQSTQSQFDTGGAASFLATSDADRVQILRTIGPEALLKQMTIHAFVGEFAREPNEMRGRFLVALIPYLATSAQVSDAENALRAADMDHLMRDMPAS
jgi:hypothetical protein